MQNDEAPRADAKHYSLSALTSAGARARLAAIGLVVLCLAGAFAFVAGWLTPSRLTQAAVIDRFEQINGIFSGFRRNHAKGVCVTGYFDSNGQGEHLSKALLFKPGRTQVFGRFALAGGQPYQVDAPSIVRSLALNFALSDGEVWRTAMINLPVFPVNTVQGFYDLLLATRPDPATGKPDPATVQAFLASHPETAKAMSLIKAQPTSSGFADATYSALNAYLFIDSGGAATPVRWSFVPVDPFVAADPARQGGENDNYLFDDLIARLRGAPAQWRLVVTVGAVGDSTSDATLPWPDSRERLDLGTLTLTQIEDEAQGPCRDINFDPLVLPSGIAPSDDPLLSARSAAYSTSFTRREGEPKEPSAIVFSNDAQSAQ